MSNVQYRLDKDAIDAQLFGLSSQEAAARDPSVLSVCVGRSKTAEGPLDDATG